MASIFLIDDDQASELLADTLKYKGHEVERAKSVDDALARIEDICASNLVVLDLVMPRLLGPEKVDDSRAAGMLVYREIRKRNPKLPILVLTANQDPALADVVSDDQAARYLSRWSGLSFRDLV